MNLSESSITERVELKVSDRLSGVGEYYFAGKLREIEAMNAAGKKVINLGIGSPDLPPHPVVIQTLYEESLKEGQHGYQNYKGHPILRQAISTWYQKYFNVAVDPVSQVLPLIGSKEGIMHICMAYLNPGDKVLVPNPGYPTYTSAAKISGGEIVYYTLDEENGYEPDLAQLEASDLSRVKLMFVNYPHMPTGKKGSKTLFEKMVSFARRNNILIVHDNPYSFILNDEPLSILSIDGAFDVAIELNSLSKSHNMAGWRLGFAVGATSHLDSMMRFKSNMDSGMFLPVQLAAAKALSLTGEWYTALNETYERRRKKAYQLLDTIHAVYSKQQSGLFVWAKIPASFTSGFEVSDAILHAANVFITPGGIFGDEGDNYIRLSLCVKEEVFSEAIQRIINTDLINP